MAAAPNRPGPITRLNRWYDGLERTHPGSRMMIFIGALISPAVAIPFAPHMADPLQVGVLAALALIRVPYAWTHLR